MSIISTLRYTNHRIHEYFPYAKRHYRLNSWGWVRLYIDCLISCVMGKCTIRDYFVNDFYLLNKRGKKEYLSGLEHNKLQNRHNNPATQAVLTNKEMTLAMLSGLVDRDWCGQEYNNTPELYETFSAKHSQAIVKPLGKCGGDGIKIVSTETEVLGTTLYEYCRTNHYLVEELIVQHSTMAMLFPKSVNSIRIVTVNGEILDAVLRVGQGESAVDNLSAGGIACPLDADTGIVVGKGRDYLGNEYVVHPQTGIPFPGFVIPNWNEAKKLVHNAIQLINGIPVIGWDIAITKDGATIVEINEGTEIEVIQVPFKKGYRFLWETLNN